MMSRAREEKARAADCRIEGEALGRAINKRAPKPRPKPHEQPTEATASPKPKRAMGLGGIPVGAHAKRVFEMRAVLQDWAASRTDHDAWAVIRAMAHQQCAATGIPAWQRHFERWLWAWLPPTEVAVVGESDLADLFEEVEDHTRYYTPRELGRLCKVTQVVAMRLDLKQLMPFDLTDEELQKARALREKLSNRERLRLKRLDAGMRPRAQSAARLKPWVVEGMSRAKWYRLQAVQNTYAAETDLNGRNIRKKDTIRSKQSHPKCGTVSSTELLIDLGEFAAGGPQAPTSSPPDAGWQAYRKAVAERVVSLPAVRQLLAEAAQSDRPFEEERERIRRTVGDLTSEILRHDIGGGRP